MTAYNTLVGYIRRIPGVYSFAIPIFLDHHGRHVAQSDRDQNGIVDGFEEIDIEPGFHPLAFPLGWRSKDPMLYAFETSEYTLSIGTSNALASHLRSLLETPTAFQSAAPKTFSAIERFIMFAQKLDIGNHPAQLFLLESRYPGLPLMSLEPEFASLNAIDASTGDMIDLLLGLLGGDHDRQIEGHEPVIRQITRIARRASINQKSRDRFVTAIEMILCEKNYAYSSQNPCEECLGHLQNAVEIARTPPEAVTQTVELLISQGVQKIRERPDLATLEQAIVTNR